MRFMVIVKANDQSEAGVMPTTELIGAMGKFNEELINAGVLVDACGLQPSVAGKRVRFSGTKRTVIDGPFAETKELIAGYWVWELPSMEQALDWVKRCPNPHIGDSDIEIRPMHGTEDFDNAPPEVVEQEKKFRRDQDKARKARAKKK